MTKKIYTIALHIPSDTPEIPYTSEKWKLRHDDLISYFPPCVQFYLVKNPENHLWENMFTPDFKRVKWEWHICHEKIYIDLVLGPNKNGSFTNIFPNPIKEFCRNKNIFQKNFPEFAITSILCKNYSDIQKNFHLILTKLKVLKPCNGSQGRGIIFSESLLSENDIEKENYPYLLQSFFDTSSGCMWYKWIHDFRTIIIDGQISWSFLRIAKPGIFTANVDSGAEVIDFWIWNIPPNIQEIITSIDKKLAKKYPQRYYSIDVWVWKSGEVKVFELNASPMLSTPLIRKNLAHYIIKNILKIPESLIKSK